MNYANSKGKKCTKCGAMIIAPPPAAKPQAKPKKK
jgi:hypothetical protein